MFCLYLVFIQCVLIKRKPGQTCQFLWNLTDNLRYYLLEGYLPFPAVPRNGGSITSVNKHEHFYKRLTIWLCTKSFKLSIYQCVLAGLNCQQTWWCNSQKSREFSLWLNCIEQLACRRLETVLLTDFLVVRFQ